MLFADVVAASAAVAAERGRLAKRDILAGILRRLAPPEIEPAVGFLRGDPRQGRLGVGWATVAGVERAPATSPTLSIGDVDRALEELAGFGGPGSHGARHGALAQLLGRCTAAEAQFLRRLLVGELRQGALDGVMTDAVAAAAGVPATAVRRAVMLNGDLLGTAAVALLEGRSGLDRVGLTVLRPVQPMLASTAAGVPQALAETGGDGPASVEWKLDGVRIQAHRLGSEVRLFTRNLNDVTDRLPDVADLVRNLPVGAAVLDGELLGMSEVGGPDAFQDTMSRFGRDDGRPAIGLRPFFFDVLHADGADLVDRPLADRLEVLDQIARGARIPGTVTSDADEAQGVLDQALAHGHEGVVVKAASSPYQAGRRGRAWRKVKPVRVYDLVVLAAEWGSGRRRGWLSNLHLGARGDDGFVMVGKTFKGLTDELLAWQTAELLARSTHTSTGRGAPVVHVRPELVVEIAIDGVQGSRRYPGGLALRFARVRRYRPDKTAAEADTIESLQALLA